MQGTLDRSINHSLLYTKISITHSRNTFVFCMFYLYSQRGRFECSLSGGATPLLVPRKHTLRPALG